MVDWNKVSEKLRCIAGDPEFTFTDGNAPTRGQRASLKAIAERLPNNGIIIADEVGMGKTRIAALVTKAVIDAEGRVAILVPPGLGYQWSDELRKSHVENVPDILRSLHAYLGAWKEEKEETERKPWAKHAALMISHSFCNWQVSSITKDNSKWSLLPQTMALMQARLRGTGRMPRGAGNQKRNYKQEVVAAAKWIIDEGDKAILESLAKQDGFNQWGNDSPFFDPGNYKKTDKDTKFREALERVIGLGLGKFDLVVIDEAHKNRGAESNLERLLSHVICASADPRRLAMTATPIELDSEQWKQMLGRINVKGGMASASISQFTKAVKEVRQSPLDEKTRDAYVRAARSFELKLGRYLLRRDKREIESVKQFACRNGGEHNDYRSLIDIAVSTADLSPAWKQAVCAAESLSFVTRGFYGHDGKRLSREEIEKAKRLRLTLGNGHGISTLMDESQRDKSKKAKSNEEQEASLSDIEGSNKKAMRIEWWNGVMSRAFQDSAGQTGEATLYEHPAILAAVEAIEAVCRQGEKVLVFGRFTKPMQALVRLLNAREMLSRFEGKAHWPQEKLHVNEHAAVESELLRRGKEKEWLVEINEWLAQQYKELENERERFRTRLRNVLGDRLNSLDENEREGALTLLARPIQEMLDVGDPDQDIIEAFNAVVSSASDQDNEDSEKNEMSQDVVGNKLNNGVLERLREEFGRTEGGFARLMNGNTEPHARRLLQLAFNRERSNPKVLVAQSVVGREGLNLHEACRTVILLHAEWNPGVVEQQIGRVDRIGSLWEKKLSQAIVDKVPAEALPKIEIRPVIFKGTYDEENWKVLRGRWDDLRAQLHGVVITPSAAQGVPKDVVESINKQAPNFSPDKPSGH